MPIQLNLPHTTHDNAPARATASLQVARGQTTRRRSPRQRHPRGSPHKKRPHLASRYPVHVVLRASPAVGNLRRLAPYQAIRRATLTVGTRHDFRIVQLSVQRSHVHLIVEANNEHSLSKGPQGFQISAAKHLNATIRTADPTAHRRGTVFPDRYYAVPITTPRQARNVLCYVLGN